MECCADTLRQITCVVNTICALIVRDRSKAIGASQLAFDRRLFLRPEFCAFQLWGVFSMLGEYRLS